MNTRGRRFAIGLVMPEPVPGIHELDRVGKKDVDGRDKPGHDTRKRPAAIL
jgi:hypothetical protein